MPEMRCQDVGDAKMRYLDYAGSGPPLVMLHATGFPPWLWHPIARELAGDFRVVAPCFCSHRPADPHEGGLSWLTLSADLAALVERLGLEEVRLVGHSMGATVSSLAEALHGPLASRMVLIEPIFLPPPFYGMQVSVEQHPMASRAIRRRRAWGSEAEARKYLGEKGLFTNWDPEALELYLEHGMTEAENGGLELACSPEQEAALFMGGQAQNPWELLDRVGCPALLLEGEASENRGLVDLERAASLMPRAEVRSVAGAGHLIPMEKPRQTLELIRSFLAA